MSSVYCSCSAMRSGISSLQGSHQVAQKLSRMILPLYDDSFTSAPFMSFTVKSSGAGFPDRVGVGRLVGGDDRELFLDGADRDRSDAAHSRPSASATDPIAIHAARRDIRGSGSGALVVGPAARSFGVRCLHSCTVDMLLHQRYRASSIT